MLCYLGWPPPPAGPDPPLPPPAGPDPPLPPRLDLTHPSPPGWTWPTPPPRLDLTPPLPPGWTWPTPPPRWPTPPPLLTHPSPRLTHPLPPRGWPTPPPPLTPLPPRCGLTNKVKLLPSRRTTYAGGNNMIGILFCFKFFGCIFKQTLDSLRAEFCLWLERKFWPTVEISANGSSRLLFFQ